MGTAVLLAVVRIVQHVLHQPAHVHALAHDMVDRLRVDRLLPLELTLEALPLAEDRRQRRLQVVGDRREEVRHQPAGLRARLGLRHLVHEIGVAEDHRDLCGHHSQQRQVIVMDERGQATERHEHPEPAVVQRDRRGQQDEPLPLALVRGRVLGILGAGVLGEVRLLRFVHPKRHGAALVREDRHRITQRGRHQCAGLLVPERDTRVRRAERLRDGSLDDLEGSARAVELRRDGEALLQEPMQVTRMHSLLHPHRHLEANVVRQPGRDREEVGEHPQHREFEERLEPGHQQDPAQRERPRSGQHHPQSRHAPHAGRGAGELRRGVCRRGHEVRDHEDDEPARQLLAQRPHAEDRQDERGLRGALHATGDAGEIPGEQQQRVRQRQQDGDRGEAEGARVPDPAKVARP